MKYVIFIIILAILKESHSLNPEILKYDQFMKDFEATGRRIKQDAKDEKMDGLVLKRESPKDLPSKGTPSFRWIIEHNQIYVDKTKYLYLMLEEEPPQKYFFLRWSEGYGKSLLIDTMNEFFRGEKELFKNTHFCKERPNYSWSSYPVIRLNFSELDIQSGDSFKVGILDRLKKIAESYNLRGMEKDMPIAQTLFTLIQALKNNTGLRVVILIDEIDYPLSKAWFFTETRQKLLEISQSFLTVLEALNDNIHFSFFTGTDNVASGHLFSNFKALDVRTNVKYAEILGFTDEEIEEYFESRIQAVVDKRNLTKERILNDYVQRENSCSGKRLIQSCSLIRFLS